MLVILLIEEEEKDFWELLKSPGSWEKRQWLVASQIMAITGLVMSLDESTRTFFADNYEQFDKVTWSSIEKIGNALIQKIQSHAALPSQ